VHNLVSPTIIFLHNFQKVVALNECVPMHRLSWTFTMLLHGSKEAKMPSFITIAICGGYIHKMTGLKSIAERICEQKLESSLIKSLSEKLINSVLLVFGSGRRPT